MEEVKLNNISCIKYNHLSQNNNFDKSIDIITFMYHYKNE